MFPFEGVDFCSVEVDGLGVVARVGARLPFLFFFFGFLHGLGVNDVAASSRLAASCSARCSDVTVRSGRWLTAEVDALPVPSEGGDKSFAGSLCLSFDSEMR